MGVLAEMVEAFTERLNASQKRSQNLVPGTHSMKMVLHADQHSFLDISES
jgi:hypothetical protein